MIVKEWFYLAHETTLPVILKMTDKPLITDHPKCEEMWVLMRIHQYSDLMGEVWL